ncbi:hypothetical protein B7463_g12443, partial [Scytalidium lignicola]
MAKSYEEVFEALLKSQQSYEVSIIKLSEPVAGGIQQQSRERTSDVSTEAEDILTPASLQADLAHYKELFAKLRFSYVEQVTKEKFIRAIVGDPPLVVEHQENVELEEELAISKAALKKQKTEVDELVEELERQGRVLARRYERIQLQTTQLQELPTRIDELQASIDKLMELQAPGANPSLCLPLEKTLTLVEERERERAELDKQLEQLQAILPRKDRELDRLNAELQPLEVKRLGSTAAARDAKRRKEEALGGVADDLEERGRWWRGVESGLKTMLDWIANQPLRRESPTTTSTTPRADEFLIQNEYVTTIQSNSNSTGLTGYTAKGTSSFGKRHNKSHTLCRRCGRRSLHVQKHTCSSCGYPAAKTRKFNWGEKAKRRKTTGTGRMRYLKGVSRRFNNDFQTGTPVGARGPASKAE